MRRVVIDTNIYIDWFAHGFHEAVLLDRTSVKFMSAVVIMELSAGASSRAEVRILSRTIAAFTRMDRLLVPSAAVYGDAGPVLRDLQATAGYDLRRSHSLVNDVLIALSARQIGAAVVTQNGRDFRNIRRIRSFELVVVRSRSSS